VPLIWFNAFGGEKEYRKGKICVIKNTLHHVKMLVSKGLYDELLGRKDIEFYGRFESLKFDKDDNLE
jgi:hypothetical protein